MIQTQFHVDQLFESLALGRYFIHKDEITRALTPILNEVYNIGYDRGIADQTNILERDVTLDTKVSDVSYEMRKNIFLGNVTFKDSPEQVGTTEAVVEVHHVESEDVKEENTSNEGPQSCEQSSPEQPESSENISSES